MPDGRRPALLAELTAPRTPTEERVAGTWAEVLGLEQIGVLDNFFDLGGHSLLATQVLSRLRAAFDVDVLLAELFDHPTVAGLAGVIEQRITEEIDRMSEADAAHALEARSAKEGGHVL